MAKKSEIKPATSIIDQIHNQDGKNSEAAYERLLTKFSQAVEDMVSDGQYSSFIDLEDDEHEVVGDLLQQGRDAGYRFRMDRTVTKTVNERGQQLGELKEEYGLFISLEHLR